MPRKKTDITVFANVFRKPGDQKPHFRGYVNVEGVKYALALWINYEIGGVPVNLSGQIELAEED